MKLPQICWAILAIGSIFTVAAPTDLPSDMSTLDERDILTKRATSCSNGIAVSCKYKSASVSCSGNVCTFCCGTCCKKANSMYIESPIDTRRDSEEDTDQLCCSSVGYQLQWFDEGAASDV